MRKNKRNNTTAKPFTKKRSIIHCIGFVLLLMAGIVIGSVIDYVLGIDYLFSGPFELLAAVGCCIIAKDRTGEKLTAHIKPAKFDISVPIMLLLFDWGAGDILIHIIGVIGSRFTSVKPDISEVGLITAILSSVIFAPLCEEIVFRFCNISVLNKKFGRAFSIIFSGAIFSAVHFYNVYNTANVFIGGMLYAYVFLSTGSLLYTMLAHAAHNTLCLVISDDIIIAGQKIAVKVNGFTLYSTPWLIINGVLFTAGLVYYFIYFRPRYCEKIQKTLSEHCAGAAI